MKKINFKPTLVLCSICLVVALMLSLINMVTAPIIEQNQNNKANEALLVVLPNGKNFKEITLDDTYPDVITKAYKADGGYVFEATVAGKSEGLVIMFGIDNDGKIVATKVIADNETNTYDENVFPLVEGTNGKYAGMDLAGYQPVLVTGATLTSQAYAEAAKAALQAYAIANGASVDIRTPEQILQDNCNTAAGTTKLTYTKWFATEVLEGVDAVYETADNSYAVYVVGEVFVAVNASDKIVTAGIDSAIADTVAVAHAIRSTSALTEITERPDSIRKTVTKMFVTGSGNYIFELSAEGFSVWQYNEYSSGKNAPIIIRVSISADGKIIDCQTVSHGESKGYGDKCATEDYYESWRGAEAGDVVISKDPIPTDTTDPGAISGATYTANGYQKAIKHAFEAFEILTGGEQNV